jgi:hypothetical protein
MEAQDLHPAIFASWPGKEEANCLDFRGSKRDTHSRSSQPQCIKQLIGKELRIYMAYALEQDLFQMRFSSITTD